MLGFRLLIMGLKLVLILHMCTYLYITVYSIFLRTCFYVLYRQKEDYNTKYTCQSLSLGLRPTLLQHTCAFHSHETPKCQNDRGDTDPTDWFQWTYAFYTIQSKMVILPNFEKLAVSVWPFKINQYIACFPNSVSNMSVAVIRKQVQKMRVWCSTGFPTTKFKLHVL